MAELLSSGGRVLFWWLLGGVLVVASVFVIIKLYYEPQWKLAYDNQVAGLATTYCSTTVSDVREASRQDLIGQRDGAPQKWAALAPQQRTRAEAVIRNDKDACK